MLFKILTFAFATFFFKPVYAVNLEKAEDLLRFLNVVSTVRTTFCQESVYKFSNEKLIASYKIINRYLLPAYPEPTDIIILEEMIEDILKSAHRKKRNFKKLGDEYLYQYFEISKRAEIYSNPTGARMQFHTLLSLFDVEPWIRGG